MARVSVKLLMIGAVAAWAAAAGAGELPGLGVQSAEQLAQWRAKWATEKARKVVQAAPEPTSFYTGKPYDQDLGVYLFKYRHYNPDLCRWTTQDPSGFPDGANNWVYAPNPVSELDPTGLRSLSDQDFWDPIPVQYYASLDFQASMILGWWLEGTGSYRGIVESGWGTYMERDSNITTSVSNMLYEYGKTAYSNGKYYKKTHVECNADRATQYNTGYGMLFGSNWNAGGFRVFGSYEVSYEEDKRYVTYNVWEEFNDIVDSNWYYPSDIALEAIARTSYNPDDYTISIAWKRDQGTWKFVYQE